MSTKFLKSSDLQQVSALIVAGSKPLLTSDSSIATLVSHIPELQHFFAEPTITFDEHGDLKSAKWYTEFDHEVRRLDDLTGEKRARAQENLDRKLNAAARHLDDPAIGDLLAAMLNIASTNSLYFVGTQPVLTDWGTTPRNAPEEKPRDRLAELYPAIFIAGAGTAAVTPLTMDKAKEGMDNDAAYSTSALADTNDNEVIEGKSLTASTAITEDLADDVVYVDKTPFYHRFWFRALFSSLFVLLFIWLLWWLFLAKPGGLLVPRMNTSGIHDGIVAGLQNERDRLQSLLDDPCAPAASTAVSRGLTGSVSALPPLPGATASGIQPPGTAPPTGNSATMPLPGQPWQMMASQTIAHKMERSVAFILSATPSGSTMMGSGFFIAPDTIVTNRHVVENADPTKIAVTSDVMGKIQKAQIVAMTSDSEIGTSDYAVLKLSTPVDVDPVALSTVAEKLGRVVAVGYPGYLTNMDSKLRALLGGDMSAAPETIFTSGEISVIQRDGQGPPIIIHTADMSQGSSGGPLVDQCGRVLGVNTFIGRDETSGRRGLFALGASDLMHFLDKINVAYKRADGACEAAPTAAQES